MTGTPGTIPRTEDAATRAERELVERARQGDGRAFAELVEPHLSLLFRVAHRATANRSLAEDAVQETLALVHRGLGRYEPGTSFKSFVAAIAARRARTLLRGEIRRRKREEAAPAGAPPPSPADLLSAEETARKIRDALALMPRKRQRVAILRLDGGLDYREIAGAVGSTEGSARVLVHLALRELHRHLEGLRDREPHPSKDPEEKAR